jgi:hypothetical protein
MTAKTENGNSFEFKGLNNIRAGINVAQKVRGWFGLPNITHSI